jgi:apolipoprotein N-acyltransferase
MGKINMGRAVLGGLLAGVILNIGEYLLNDVLLIKKWSNALAALSRSMPGGAGNNVFFIILFFALGVFTVWLYAAIRPRFGAGPTTAVCAGLIVWFLASLFTSATLYPMHLFPSRLLLYGTVWELFEFPIAALAGAWIYREESQ